VVAVKNAETQIGVIARTIWIVLGSPSEVALIELVEVSPQLLGFGLADSPAKAESKFLA
jgi:hypothetical protein